MTVRIKRIYEPAEEGDGVRILIDRIWPRGISRYDARISFWEKDAAPTTELRKWFKHEPERWQEFRRRYRTELQHNPAAKALRTFAKRRTVTLVYAARDEEHNHARVLAAFLRRPALRQVRSAFREN